MSNVAAMPDGARVWTATDGLHVDVRGLPCPEPMVTLLRLIDGGHAGDGMLAHVSQEPLLLYPELDERGWRYRLIDSADADTQGDEVVLEISRGAP